MSAASSPGRPPLRRAAPVIATAAAAVVTVLAGVVAYRVYTGRPVTVAGTVTITENVIGGRTCLGANGDEDLHEDAAVVVRAPSNEIVATGRLDEGTGTHLIAGSAQTCRFTFAVPGVPRERFYRVAVGGRGPAVFTYAQVVHHEVTLPAH
jgi:hypothetical protein